MGRNHQWRRERSRGSHGLELKMARPKGNLSLLDRLLNKVVINDLTDCWEYQGGKNNIGYGMIRDEDKMRTAHRVSYEEHNNVKIPKYMCVCHTCDNPICVNPKHLWLGTMMDNINDMIQKGRQKCFGGTGMKGKKQPKTLCVNCNREISNNLFSRYHGDKCKDKP